MASHVHVGSLGLSLHGRGQRHTRSLGRGCQMAMQPGLLQAVVELVWRRLRATGYGLAAMEVMGRM